MVPNPAAILGAVAGASELEVFALRVRGHGQGDARRVLVVSDAEAADRLQELGFAVERTESADLSGWTDHSLDGIWLGRPLESDFRDAFRVLHHGLLRVPLVGDDARDARLELALERAEFQIVERLRGLTAWTRLITPRVGTCGVLLDDRQRVLLTERADDRGWCLPGGYSDPMEPPQETVVRETREETGLEVEVERLLGVYSVTQRAGTKIVACSFFCRVVGGELRTTDETIDVGWFEESALPERIFSTHRQRIVDAYAFFRDPSLPPFVRDGVEQDP
jgi:8-oxo-dGTP diphosphatase